MVYERLFKWIFITSFLLMVLAAYYKDDFPEPHTYEAITLDPPIQTDTSRDPFSIAVNQQHYVITPKFDYDLTGVVVTYNDPSGLTDIWHHDIWKDFINVRDLCVIWGSNVRTGIYKNISFSSDSWTCWFSWQDSETNRIFQPTDLSNNHILTDSNQIKSVLLSAEKGDVIHFKGVLAEYRNDAVGFSRGTSTIRKDTGNGACETVYIDEFRIIKKANPILRNFYALTKWMSILSFIGFVIMFTITPIKPK